MPATPSSTAVYRLLLRAYPAAFQRAYGAQMIAAFERQRLEPRYATPIGRLTFWFDILTDLSASAKQCGHDRPHRNVPIHCTSVGAAVWPCSWKKWSSPARPSNRPCLVVRV